MNFGILDKICTFAMFYAKELTSMGNRDFYILSSDVLSIKIKAIKLRWLTCFHTCKCSLARMEGDSLSSFNNFKIHSQMPKNNELEVQVQSVPTSQPKSQSKLEKEIATIQKKVAVLQAECKTHESEKYRLLCYIDRYCSCLLSNFLENNPLDSRDWKKLHKQQLDIREAIK